MQVKMNLRLGSLEILNENSFRLTALLGMTAPKSVLLENTTVQFFLGLRDPGVSLKGRISRLPEQPCWLYA